MPLHALYVAKTKEYVTARWELAQTLAGEKAAWFEALDESAEPSVSARKEYADARTVGFRVQALKLQGQVDGLRALVDCLGTLVAAGATDLPGGA